MKRVPPILAVLLTLAAGLTPLCGEEPAGQPLKLTPETIQMGAFYSGMPLRIEGMVRPGSSVVVVVRGPDVEEVFNLKGRAGPIWINKSKVHISGAPSLFLCFHIAPLKETLSLSVLEKYQIGYEEIHKQMRIQPPEQDREVVRASFITLKTQENVYRNIRNGVQMGTATPAGVPYSVEFHWPRRAPPAAYEVKAYECRDHTVVSQTIASLKVVEVGFPAWMAWFARKHASLYGLMAVIVAMLAGFGIDLLASRLRRKGIATRAKPSPAETHPEAAPAGAGKGESESEKPPRGLKPAA
ncbi:MAG: TIGR02186 family protein [Acidobacteriia bacterium]|nr:TIGR02186 family protein [Terriglobia bacterium]